MSCLRGIHFVWLVCILLSSNLALGKYTAMSEVLKGDGWYRPYSYKVHKVSGPGIEKGISIHREFISESLPVERFYQLVAMALEQEKMFPEELIKANEMAQNKNEEGIYLYKRLIDLALGNINETQFSAISVTYQGDGDYLPDFYERVVLYGPGIGSEGLHLNPRLVPEKNKPLTFFKQVAEALNSQDLTLDIIMPARAGHLVSEDVRPGLKAQIQWHANRSDCLTVVSGSPKS